MSWSDSDSKTWNDRTRDSEYTRESEYTMERTERTDGDTSYYYSKTEESEMSYGDNIPRASIVDPGTNQKIEFGCHKHPMAGFMPRSVPHNFGYTVRTVDQPVTVRIPVADIVNKGSDYCVKKPIISSKCLKMKLGDMLHGLSDADSECCVSIKHYAILEACVVDWFCDLDTPMHLSSCAFKGTVPSDKSHHVFWEGRCGASMLGNSDGVKLHPNVHSEVDLHRGSGAMVLSPDEFLAFTNAHQELRNHTDARTGEMQMEPYFVCPPGLMALLAGFSQDKPEIKAALFKKKDSSGTVQLLMTKGSRDAFLVWYRHYHTQKVGVLSTDACIEFTPQEGWGCLAKRLSEKYDGTDLTEVDHCYDITIFLRMRVVFPYCHSSIMNAVAMRRKARYMHARAIADGTAQEGDEIDYLLAGM